MGLPNAAVAASDFSMLLRATLAVAFDVMAASLAHSWKFFCLRWDALRWYLSEEKQVVGGGGVEREGKCVSVLVQ